LTVNGFYDILLDIEESVLSTNGKIMCNDLSKEDHIIAIVTEMENKI